MRDNPSAPGVAVDSHGGAVIDPSANVLDLVQAAIRRQDDLRDMSVTYQEKLADLRDQHARELRIAEAERINAIRAVDVSAVQSAATVSATTASTLAAQVATSAETLRTQVAAAATASTVALAAALEPIQKDIADLRRVQYETAGGKTQTVEARDELRGNTGTITLILFSVSIVLTIVLHFIK